MTLFRSPMRDRHALVQRLCGHDGRAPLHDNVLYGERTMKWPVLALMSNADFGNARHALSQMVVAGTMTVHPPIVIQQDKDEEREGEAPPEPLAPGER